MLRRPSAYSGQSVADYIIFDRVGETDGFTIEYDRSIYAASLELVDECLVVIGTHTSPAVTANLMIEYCSSIVPLLPFL
jgi:hypothetical protein